MHLFKSFLPAGLVTLLVFLSVLGIQAQNYPGTTWSTDPSGTHDLSGLMFRENPDSLLYDVSPYYLNPTTAQMVFRVFRKSDLSLKDEIPFDTISHGSNSSYLRQFGIIPHLPDDSLTFTTLQFGSTSTTWYNYRYKPVTSRLQLIKKTTHPGAITVFSRTINKEVLQMDLPNRPLTIPDTVTLKTRDYTGQVNRSNDILIDSTTAIRYPMLVGNVIGPYSDPRDSTNFLLGYQFGAMVASFDLQSLSPNSVTPYPPNNMFFSPGQINGYAFTDQKIYAVGSGNLLRNINNPVFTLQTYLAERNWDGSNTIEKALGDTMVDERGYGFVFDRQSQQGFIASAAPFSSVKRTAPEYREIVLYRFNQQGRDSIRLFGSENHSPYGLTYDEKSHDLFVKTIHSKAWSTQETKFTITKIPSFALSQVENGRVEKAIHVYPNPARDYVFIKNLPCKVDQVGFYRQDGRLLKTFENPQEKISVAEFSKGIYVLVVNCDRKRYTSILRVQ
jgi:hypothetical protein